MSMPPRDVLFGVWRPEYDHRLMVVNLTGQTLPSSAVVQLACSKGRSVELTRDFTIPIRHVSAQERQVELIRSLAFRFYPRCVSSDAFPNVQVFEGILGPLDAHVPMSRRSIAVEILVPNLFCLPLFQWGVLEAAYDSLSDQPFTEPVSRQELKLAGSISLQSGDYLVVRCRGVPACLALRREIGQGLFEADLFASSESITIDHNDVLVARVDRTIQGTHVSFSAEIARVSDVYS